MIPEDKEAQLAEAEEMYLVMKQEIQEGTSTDSAMYEEIFFGILETAKQNKKQRLS